MVRCGGFQAVSTARLKSGASTPMNTSGRSASSLAFELAAEWRGWRASSQRFHITAHGQGFLRNRLSTSRRPVDFGAADADEARIRAAGAVASISRAPRRIAEASPATMAMRRPASGRNQPSRIMRRAWRGQKIHEQRAARGVGGGLGGGGIAYSRLRPWRSAMPVGAFDAADLLGVKAAAAQAFAIDAGRVGVVTAAVTWAGCPHDNRAASGDHLGADRAN